MAGWKIQGWEFSQDTGEPPAPYAKTGMWSFMITESGPRFNFPSPAARCPHHCAGALEVISTRWKIAPYWPTNTTSSSKLSPIQLLTKATPTYLPPFGSRMLHDAIEPKVLMMHCSKSWQNSLVTPPMNTFCIADCVICVSESHTAPVHTCCFSVIYNTDAEDHGTLAVLKSRAPFA